MAAVFQTADRGFDSHLELMSPLEIIVDIVGLGVVLGLTMRWFWTRRREAEAKPYTVEIVSGTGQGQTREILEWPNDDVMVIDRPWDVVPDDTSVLDVRV